jgi:putative membrane protein
MTNYNYRSYWHQLFRVRHTVWQRIWGRIIVLMAFTAGLVYLDQLNGPQEHWFLVSITPIGHQLVAVAVGLLMVFRNSYAYQRYQEGRRQWDLLIGHTRALVRQAHSYVGAVPDLGRLASEHAWAVRNELRGAAPKERTALVIRQELSNWVQAQFAASKLPINFAVLMEVRIAGLAEAQTVCEGIQSTPLPLHMSVHIKQVVFIFLATLPLVLADLGWFAVLAIGLIAFALLGIDEAAVEFEDPFGDDPYDLPLDHACQQLADEVARTATLPAGK